jgi:Carboxypeptidase regulatory-like domain
VVRNSLFAIACLLLFLSLRAMAQMEIVDIEKPQFAKSVAGIVTDPSHAVLGSVTVEERSEDWKKVLRTTETDGKGRFRFPARSNTVYYLEFSRSGFNWVRLTLQLDKKAKPGIMVEMPLGT